MTRESTELPIPDPGSEDGFTAALRASAGPPLADDGFVAGVMRRIAGQGAVAADHAAACLHARQRRELRQARWVRAGAAIGALAAVALAVALAPAAGIEALSEGPAIVQQAIAVSAVMLLLMAGVLREDV